MQSKAITTMPFYAVQLGKKPGVYTSWSECQEQTTGFKGARFKKFDTEEEALDFVKGKAVAGKTEKKEKDAKVSSSTAGSKRKASKDKKSEESGSDSEDGAGTSKKKVDEKKKRKVAKDNSGDESSESETKGPTEDDPDAVTVYTDGCCFSNGKGNPNGGVGVYWGPDHPNNLSEKLEGRQTNNRAEIYAALRAIQQAKKVGVKKLIIKTDSSFLVNCQTNWVKKWKKNGWKTSTGADVTNRDELQELDKEEQDFSVTYIHVPAHKGIEGNEAADKLAKAGAKK